MAKYLDETGLGLVWGKIKSKFIAQNSDVESGHVAVFTVDDSGNNTIIGLADGGTVATSTHAHGNITNGGAITATGVTIANGDALTIVDSSASGKLVKSSITFDGSTTSKYLSQAGTWVSTINSHQDWGLVAAAQNGTSNVTSATSNPYINLVKGSTPTFDSGVQLKGGGIVGVSANSGAITITASHATHKLTATNGTATAGTNSITYIESLTGTNTATSGDLTVTATRKTLSDIVTGSGLTADTIILGNGSGAVQTSGKTIETSITANSDDKVPTSQAVASYVSTQLGSLTGALVYKGTIASSGGTVTALPASHAVGDVYVVATAGTYAGKVCEVGDMVICNKAGTTASDSDWTVVNGENQVSQSNSEFTTDATSKAFAVVDGTTLNLKVTHHTPSGGSAMSTTAGTAVGWSGAVITGLTSDGKGHITGVTTGTIPANPAKDVALKVASDSGTATQVITTNSSTARTLTVNGDGTWITGAVSGSSNAAVVTLSHAGPGNGTDLAATNTDTTAYTNGGEYTVVTGVTITKDDKGHVTGLKEARQTIKSSIAQYSLPVAKYNTLGGIKPAYTTTGAATGYTAASNTSTPALNARTTTAGKYYAVEADKDGVAFVNVPWTDTSVTSSANHYTPSGTNAMTNTASGSGVSWGGAVVTSLTSDGKGHITGVKTSTLPSNPNVTTAAFVAGSSTATAATAAGTAITNGNLYYIIREGSTNTATLITGAGATTVTKGTDATNKIVITSTDTLNTAGSSDTSSKIFLIGATSQSSTGVTTYSHDTAYVGTDGCLYSNSAKVMVAGDVQELDSDDIDRICV